MARPRSTPEQAAAYRLREQARHKANREKENQHSRDRRADPAINYAMNERRREKAFRHVERQRETESTIINEIFGTDPHAASVVNAQHLRYDLSTWRGPGMTRTARIDLFTTAWLKRAEREKRRNSKAQEERSSSRTTTSTTENADP